MQSCGQHSVGAYWGPDAWLHWRQHLYQRLSQCWVVNKCVTNALGQALKRSVVSTNTGHLEYAAKVDVSNQGVAIAPF